MPYRVFLRTCDQRALSIAQHRVDMIDAPSLHLRDHDSAWENKRLLFFSVKNTIPPSQPVLLNVLEPEFPHESTLACKN